MTHPNVIQLRIVEHEEKLKEVYGYTTEALEKIGLDCPTAKDYLVNLMDVLEKHEQEDAELLREVLD